MHSSIASTFKSLSLAEIPTERKKILHEIIDYIEHKAKLNEAVKLIFICTHNSRRSQLAQIWAQAAARYYNIEASCYSGGIEVTAFNERAVEAIKRAGFKVSKEGYDNPVYWINDSNTCHPLGAYSKLYDDRANPTTDFAAIMTCSDADKNCPVIAGAEVRIPLRYDDPKEFDDSPLETEKYDDRSNQIAKEMNYVFSTIIT